MHSFKKGQAIIQTVGLLFFTLFTGAFAIDAGLYFYVHQGMQNAADAAALAGAMELFEDVAPNITTRFADARAAARSLSVVNRSTQIADADIDFGYVDPITGVFAQGSFNSPTNNPAFAATGGYNAVRVIPKAVTGEANNPVPSIFAKVLGFNSFTTKAKAVAIYGGGVYSASGLRPVYMCQTAWDQATALYGDPTTPEITFYGDTLRVGTNTINQANSCGSLGPGNWGLADLNNQGGVPGVNTVRDWFTNGYNGQVFTGTNYESETGTPIHTFDDALTTLQNNGTVISIPLYDATSGVGANEEYHVSQIASFVITGFQTTGNQSQRYIKGYFRRTVCSSGCSLGNSTRAGGVTTLRLVN
jgi:hypothetical protein